MFLFKDTEAMAGDWYSDVSAMTSLFCVSWRVFDFCPRYAYAVFVLRNLYLG